ncbi:MAG: phosphocholine cytidylyltransferase family protein [Acetobacteraceae bacterium]|nr:phosphocholine cytidylyltransferase family protein [Acetobacteraceae bacterium]MBV8522777.1 phosphocholine cytidylyltransferase family protein [Acetobacteraceae bacterium]
MMHFSSCRALILAAGQGRRLGPGAPAKALLTFGGRSLLARHFDALDACGVQDITIMIGYRSGDVRCEIARLGSDARVHLIENPSFREGSITTLWHARSVLRSGVPILLMDADVLYEPQLIGRLLQSPHGNCFLLDREIEPGEEPVKLCIQNGRIVDFHKRPQIRHEWHAESVGFFRFSPGVAAELADRVAEYVNRGRTDMEYEEPIRDMVLARNGSDFGFEDITGLPWIEIDFPEDVARAEAAILPKLTA